MAPRKRAAFTLAGRSSDDDDDEDGALSKGPAVVLDDQEQAQVIEDLKQLSDQSSMLWRISSLILETICIAVFLFIPLPHHSVVHLSPSYLFSRSFILLELLLGALSSITEFVTTLPEDTEKTPRLFKHNIRYILSLPPELSSSATQMNHLKLSAPLLAALLPASVRAASALYAYYHGNIPSHDALTFSTPFIALLISFLARSYANELDRDIGELKTLKYANKGV